MSYSYRLIGLLGLCGLMVLGTGCSTSSSYKGGKSVSHVSGNICKITDENPHYQKAALLSEQKWGTPANILLAIVHQESRFQSDARPRMKYVGGVPVGHISSAYGYSQALDGTWGEYRRNTGNMGARRNNIYDAMDFIGWYNHQTYERSGIAKTDAYNLYLAYHEGQGGYNRGTYHKKPWLKRVAKKVQNQAYAYNSQLDTCTIYVDAGDRPNSTLKPTKVAKKAPVQAEPKRPAPDQLADNRDVASHSVADLFGKKRTAPAKTEKTSSADLPPPSSCRNWPYC
ncbi:transglycosylase SLT domain-containing protein [Thiomicrospira sp. WB1]|uniref:transglycosylase SLT domain-containing protein n=1 Tax=Thiomicrospira sp. WB1 TaxID=1685380 RepID=UPI000AC8050E|nr:transglycosylase SLT domain-containing protein [Thiomicrospira sp. WB1]